eukprot:gene24966-31366_t
MCEIAWESAGGVTLLATVKHCEIAWMMQYSALVQTRRPILQKRVATEQALHTLGLIASRQKDLSTSAFTNYVLCPRIRYENVRRPVNMMYDASSLPTPVPSEDSHTATEMSFNVDGMNIGEEIVHEECEEEFEEGVMFNGGTQCSPCASSSSSASAAPPEDKKRKRPNKDGYNSKSNVFKKMGVTKPHENDGNLMLHAKDSYASTHKTWSEKTEHSDGIATYNCIPQNQLLCAVPAHAILCVAIVSHSPEMVDLGVRHFYAPTACFKTPVDGSGQHAKHQMRYLEKAMREGCRGYDAKHVYLALRDHWPPLPPVNKNTSEHDDIDDEFTIVTNYQRDKWDAKTIAGIQSVFAVRADKPAPGETGRHAVPAVPVVRANDADANDPAIGNGQGEVMNVAGEGENQEVIDGGEEEDEEGDEDEDDQWVVRTGYCSCGTMDDDDNRLAVWCDSYCHFGCVCITERHTTKGNEDQNLLRKSQFGAEWFITQGIFA